MRHIQLKIFTNSSERIRFHDAIPVFHRWIQSGALPEVLIDVVDYSHVPAGPGVMLIGHEASYSLDNTGNRPGLLYSRHSSDDLTLSDAYASALAAASLLEKEPEFTGKLSFDSRRFEIILNDRLLYPNNQTTWQTVEPEFQVLFTSVFGPQSYSVTRPADPRTRLSVEVG